MSISRGLAHVDGGTFGLRLERYILLCITVVSTPQRPTIVASARVTPGVPLMTKTFRPLALVVWLNVLSAAAYSAVVDVPASRDTTIFQNNVNNSSGGGNGLLAGTNGTGSPRRGLVGFNIAGAVPAGSTTQSV